MPTNEEKQQFDPLAGLFGWFGGAANMIGTATANSLSWLSSTADMIGKGTNETLKFINEGGKATAQFANQTATGVSNAVGKGAEDMSNVMKKADLGIEMTAMLLPVIIPATVIGAVGVVTSILLQK